MTKTAGCQPVGKQLARATLWCFAAAFAFAGCTAAQGQRISTRQTEMDNVRREIKFLRQQNSQLQRELDKLKKQLADLEFANKQDKADMAARVDEVLSQMEATQSQLHDTNFRISSFDRRPASTSSQPDPTFPTDPPDTVTSQPNANPRPFEVDRSRELYNTAYRDLIRGNYQLALQGFQQFTRQYTNSDLIDNAQYWIGEVFYAQGRYQNAIDEFEKVLKLYRAGDKTASSMLKIGYSYINMDEVEQGKIYLEEILNDYPETEEANLARGRLANLN